MMEDKKIEIPESVEVDLFVNLYVTGDIAGRVEVNSYDVSGFDYSEENINILKVTETIDLSGVELSGEKIRNDLIVKFEADIQKVKAEAFKKEQDIKEKINNLLAIEHKT